MSKEDYLAYLPQEIQKGLLEKQDYIDLVETLFSLLDNPFNGHTAELISNTKQAIKHFEVLEVTAVINVKKAQLNKLHVKLMNDVYKERLDEK